jgi:hypothetical protein
VLRVEAAEPIDPTRRRLEPDAHERGHSRPLYVRAVGRRSRTSMHPTYNAPATHGDRHIEVEDVIAEIGRAFRDTPHSGDRFLQGSFEGSEPREVAEAFSGFEAWSDVPTEILDGHYTALGFLSEGGFRFFLPAYLVADLRGRLRTADPVFHLTHGFAEGSRSAFVNPRRYGAMTWLDYARMRLSVFAREEAAAVVGYLEYRRERDEHGIAEPAIDAALTLFWYERASAAPRQRQLSRG